MASGINAAFGDILDSVGSVGELLDPRQGPTVIEFFDFFFSDNLGRPANNLNAFVQWNVTGGSVDLVGGVGPGVFGAPPEQPLGRYVDLGGSTGDPGLFETRLAFPVIAGQTYNFTFDYRSTGGDLNRATAFVGDRAYTVSSSSTDFDRFSTTFTATETGSVRIAFQGDETDRDNSGIGIDGVQFGQVLEPQRGDFFGDANANVFVGGAGDDRISGRGGNDILSGADGDDTINGEAGSDLILGGAGNDRLDGGSGSDVLAGGIGDDTYIVDSRSDQVAESTDQGNDTVVATASYALFDGQEIETLRLASTTGSSGLSLTGNEFANTLVGNDGSNRLDGGTGADILIGGRGNDTYTIDDTGDQVRESSVAGGGRDTARTSVDHTLAANVEVLVQTGSGAIDATGNDLANTITGNSGANVLDGGLGNDILTGGAGQDTFLFSTTIERGNIDRITSFSVVDDTIGLDAAIFRDAGREGTLNADSFKDITDGAALDANDRILYNHDTGRIFYDSDGSGSQKAVTFAILDNHPTLTFQDFEVV